MVIEPRSHVALMREPRVFVAGRYFECMACMMFESGGDRPPEATAADSLARGIKSW